MQHKYEACIMVFKSNFAGRIPEIIGVNYKRVTESRSKF